MAVVGIARPPAKRGRVEEESISEVEIEAEVWLRECEGGESVSTTETGFEGGEEGVGTGYNARRSTMEQKLAPVRETTLAATWENSSSSDSPSEDGATFRV